MPSTMDSELDDIMGQFLEMELELNSVSTRSHSPTKLREKQPSSISVSRDYSVDNGHIRHLY